MAVTSVAMPQERPTVSQRLQRDNLPKNRKTPTAAEDIHQKKMLSHKTVVRSWAP